MRHPGRVPREAACERRPWVRGLVNLQGLHIGTSLAASPTQTKTAPEGAALMLLDFVSLHALFFALRRKAMAPATPAPNSDSVMGSGTGIKKPRISPPGKFTLWIFK